MHLSASNSKSDILELNEIFNIFLPQKKDTGFANSFCLLAVKMQLMTSFPVSLTVKLSIKWLFSRNKDISHFFLE